MRIEDDILRVASRSPDRVAIEDGDRLMRFGELDEASETLSRELADSGVRRGEPVWILMPNRPEFVVGVLATLRRGAVAAPVNSSFTCQERSRLARTCPPAAIICEANVAGHILDTLTEDLLPRAVLALDSDGYHVRCIRPMRWGAGERTLASDRGEPGLVLFTSGSTGHAKAVLLSHESVSTAVRSTSSAFGLTESDRSALCLPMHHSIALARQMLAHLGMGSTIVMTPRFFQPAVVLDVILRRSCTTLFAVPSVHTMLLEQIRRSGLKLPSLRLLVSGGAPLPEATLQGLRQASPDTEIINYYGLTEASPVSYVRHRQGTRKTESVGRPIDGVEIIVAAENGEALSPGEIGELCVRSEIVMTRYLNAPEATAHAIRNGYLHTGDVGWKDEDGYLYLSGRKDDLILRGAENVYPLEIENTLCNHQDVLEAAVVGVPDRILGSDLVAFVVLRPNRGVEARELKAHCRKSLARFKIPHHIRTVDRLPKTATGKVLRRVLRDSVGGPAPQALSPAFPLSEEA